MSEDEADKLAHMAGQIAGFFHSLPDGPAAAAIAGHINQFWAPPMRREFVAHFAANPASLPPLVRAALPLIRVPVRQA